MLKVYESLDEAIGDVQGTEETRSLKLEFVKGPVFGEERQVYLKEKLTPFILSLADCTLEHGVKEYSERQSMICTILGELITNAHRHGVRNPDEWCSSHFYIGARGALLGTRQSNNFLTEEQICLLMKNERVPQVHKEEGKGDGIEIITEIGDGILILPEEKAIYVSKMYK